MWKFKGRKFIKLLTGWLCLYIVGIFASNIIRYVRFGMAGPAPINDMLVRGYFIFAILSSIGLSINRGTDVKIRKTIEERETPQLAEEKEVRAKEIIKEKEVIVKIRCPYCGNVYDETKDKCPYCGGKR